MDELEQLKSHWHKDSSQDKQLTAQEIYPMLWKKSSSIVKTLFYISIAELLFWILVNFLPLLSTEYSEKMIATFGNENTFWGLTAITFGIIFLFIYLLYKSYKRISITDSPKVLMQNIIKTRKIIKYYVIYNLTVILITFPVTIYYTLKNDLDFAHTIEAFSQLEILGFIGGMVLFTLVFLLLFWLFYRLLYGILLKRLNINYKELQKLES